MLLKNKIAIVYGAGGAIGGAVARAFALDGAKLYLAGRNKASVDAVAESIVSSGGSAKAGQVDALDEQAVGRHLQSIADESGRIDIVFNAMGISGTDILGTPLIDLPLDSFMKPVTAYAKSYFLIARLAARRMLEQKSGVIMIATTQHARMGLALSGGYGPAMAAEEALTRVLSAELAPHGIRVVGLRPQAIPETVTLQEAHAARAPVSGLSYEQFQKILAQNTHPKRLMTLAEMANMAVFMASERASGMTGTTVNLTMGSLDD